MTELNDLSVAELRRRIGRKAVSPVELLAACRRRIDAVNPVLNAITATCWERAEAEARSAEKAALRGEALGPFHGIPIGIKDTQVTEGVRTTFGSPLFADNVPRADERLVRVLREAGAIVVGKTNVPEFGAGANSTNPVYGTTANPHDPTLTCGGSSGGSAVALATSMTPLATGSDTGGSLRIPAALCGVVGMRCSPGVVPRAGRAIGWSPLSVYGPIARSVDEACTTLSVIAGRDRGDPLGFDPEPKSFARPEGVDLSTLRVAFSEDLGFAPVEPANRNALRRAVEGLGGLFADIDEQAPPLDDADHVFEVLRAVQFFAGHEKHYREHRDQLGPNLIENVEQALSYSFADVARAQTAHTRLYERFVDYMTRYDVLLCPVTSSPAFDKNTLAPREIEGQPARTYFHWLAPSYGITLTAHPAISLPCGVDDNGMPFGVQVVGRMGEDARLLGIAGALERAIADNEDLRPKRPDLAKLAGDC